MKTYLTAKQAAEMIGVSVDHVRSLIKLGSLRATNVGRGRKLPRWRIDTEELEAFMLRHRSGVPNRRPRRRLPDVPQYV